MGSFVRSSGDFFKDRESADFYDAEILNVFWETKSEIVKRLLPPPLKPASMPIVLAFIANYPKTNFGVSYLESALFLSAEFNGEEGIYCLAMPVTNDMALVAGREVYGYPKKMANISLNIEKRMVNGWVERHNIKFFEVQAKLTGQLNSDDALELLMKRVGTGQSKIVVYNYKHFPSPEGRGYDYHPRLIREEITLKPSQIRFGKAEIKLVSSENDPWSEIEIERIIGAVYMKTNNSMLKGTIVAELNPEKFTPFAFLKWDKYM